MEFSKQQGGLLINGISKDDAFIQFLQNSNINILSRGSFGITFVAKWNKDIEQSPYTHIDASMFGKKVASILFKISIIDDKEKRLSYTYSGKEKHILTSRKDNFIKEVNIQTAVFMASSKYLRAYCPSIVYADILPIKPADLFGNENNREDETIIENALNILVYMDKIDTLKEKTNVIEKLIEYSQKGEITNVGIIAMQYMDGYETLNSIENKKVNSLITNEQTNTEKETVIMPTDIKIVAMYLSVYYLIVKMVLDTGYSHGDFHKSNILINRDEDFGDEMVNGIVMGRPMIIDFGLSLKLTQPQMEQVKMYYKHGKYSNIIRYLCTLGRGDGKMVLTKNKIYNWVCKSSIFSLFDKLFVEMDNSRKKMDRKNAKLLAGSIHLPLFQTNWKKNPLLNNMFIGYYNTPIEINTPLFSETEPELTSYTPSIENTPPIENTNSIFASNTSYDYNENINSETTNEKENIPEINNKINEVDNFQTISPNIRENFHSVFSQNNTVNKSRRKCPNGSRYNKKTKKCEEYIKKEQFNQTIKSFGSLLNNETNKNGRCPRGTRRNKKTGLCENTGQLPQQTPITKFFIP